MNCKEKPLYEPDYSELGLQVMESVSSAFPYVTFVVFETRMMNDFLNHLIGRNTVFVQIEKESGGAVFRYLQESFPYVLYKPSIREMELYWRNDCVIVTDLISEAPLWKDRRGYVTLEKMLVDMCCDRLIRWSYSEAEYPDVVVDARDQYQLDRRKMLRYAGRRNKRKEIEGYLNAESRWKKFV